MDVALKRIGRMLDEITAARCMVLNVVLSLSRRQTTDTDPTLFLSYTELSTVAEMLLATEGDMIDTYRDVHRGATAAVAAETLHPRDAGIPPSHPLEEAPGVAPPPPPPSPIEEGGSHDDDEKKQHARTTQQPEEAEPSAVGDVLVQGVQALVIGTFPVLP